MSQLIYVCSPFRGDEEANTRRARNHCRSIVAQGYVPIAPHLFFPQFMDDNSPEEREQAMRMNFVLLNFCDEIWVFGRKLSTGMQREIDQAARLRIPVVYKEEAE